MKIATVIGARPQFIKAALVYEALRIDTDSKLKIKEILIHTGQHYDYNMSKKFFEELDIRRPDYNLSVGSAPYVRQITKMMQKLEVVLKKERPDIVMVYGDTNSTLAGALAGAGVHIPVCHVEAGLRSYDKSMPEEINRVLTDHLSSILFCPTKGAVNNLHKENIKKGIYFVGDIMYELAVKAIKVAQKKSRILKGLKLEPKKYILATVHRQANTDIKANLQSIVNAFGKIKTSVIFPVHPRTEKMLKKFGLFNVLTNQKNVIAIKPVGYLDMISLECNAAKIITDSGGVQKEAYFFKIPCLTLRNETEWVETLENKWNILVGANARKIATEANNDRRPGKYLNYYGNGDTSRKIVNILRSFDLKNA